MKNQRYLPLLLFITFLLVSGTSYAGTITIDFEGLWDGTIIADQYLPSGIVFSGATALTAGISLNESEFPPHSGSNVVFDDGGPISILFSTPVIGFSGFFNYVAPLTIEAFDAGGNFLASAFSEYANNLTMSGDSGSSPNELLQVLYTGGISSVLITGDTAGSSFTLDDATIATPVPEPSTLILILTNGLAIFSAKRRGR